MEEYFIISNATRNVEQQYCSLLKRKYEDLLKNFEHMEKEYNEEIRNLKDKILELDDKKAKEEDKLTIKKYKKEIERMKEEQGEIGKNNTWSLEEKKMVIDKYEKEMKKLKEKLKDVEEKKEREISDLELKLKENKEEIKKLKHALMQKGDDIKEDGDLLSKNKKLLEKNISSTEMMLKKIEEKYSAKTEMVEKLKDEYSEMKIKMIEYKTKYEMAERMIEDRQRIIEMYENKQKSYIGHKTHEKQEEIKQEKKPLVKIKPRTKKFTQSVEKEEEPDTEDNTGIEPSINFNVSEHSINFNLAKESSRLDTEKMKGRKNIRGNLNKVEPVAKRKVGSFKNEEKIKKVKKEDFKMSKPVKKTAAAKKKESSKTYKTPSSSDDTFSSAKMEEMILIDKTSPIVKPVDSLIVEDIHSEKSLYSGKTDISDQKDTVPRENINNKEESRFGLYESLLEKKVGESFFNDLSFTESSPIIKKPVFRKPRKR